MSCYSYNRKKHKDIFPFGKAWLGLIFFTFLLLTACARIDNPDGGWYDETPPHVVGATPADKALHVKSKKVTINFDEFIKIDDASSKVIVSPPQLEQPEIKATGKEINVSLKDSLKANTTYTIDFSDAISDNNEGNPLGSYTYSFSTGDVIDTLEVSGTVLDASNLEPVKGILVGLYSDLADSAFAKQPMLRVSRTDDNGHFVIKGIAPGRYRVYALQDMDNNFFWSQKGEKLAFSHDIVVPSCKADTRQDTIWRDSLHIASIKPVGYTHFLPDDICLRAFTETLTDRYFLKADRKNADHFTLFFSYGDSQLPELKGLNFNSKDAFIIEANDRKDTITYWLRDTALVNQDTLRLQMTYQKTDSLGKLVPATDTLEVLAKTSYARRLKEKERQVKDWEKRQKKLKDRGEPYDSIMPAEALKPEIKVQGSMDPDENVAISFPAPLARMDTSMIHLYAKHDSLWYRAKFRIDHLQARNYLLRAEWRPDIEYSLEIDSAAFTDIYGRLNAKIKQGFKVKNLDEYSSLFMTLEGMKGKACVVQLLDSSDKPVKEVRTKNGTAEFYYLSPGKYYLRMFEDENDNGRWDTGDYAADRQPEPVYYYPRELECKAKWDLTENWNPTALPLARQKPGAITKQKGEKQKTIQHKNADRAKKLGIPLPDYLKQK